MIGIDLDGVIIDHHENKLALAREFGFNLERWQTNTNVMRKFIPEAIYEKLQISLYGALTPKAPAIAGALEGLKGLQGKAYIISARNNDSISFAQEWLSKNEIYNIIPKEKIIFCSSGSEKAPFCQRFNITHFLDDKLSFLNFLPDKIKKILFDVDGVAEKIALDKNIQPARSWKDFLNIINPP